jgi:hypothetical protein
MNSLRKPAVSPNVVKFTASDVITLYKALDPLGKGEMSTVDFIKNLKASQEIATKFGMPERVRRESTTRDSYQLIMGSFECNEAKAISVRVFFVLNISTEKA